METKTDAPCRERHYHAKRQSAMPRARQRPRIQGKPPEKGVEMTDTSSKQQLQAFAMLPCANHAEGSIAKAISAAQALGKKDLAQ